MKHTNEVIVSSVPRTPAAGQNDERLSTWTADSNPIPTSEGQPSVGMNSSRPMGTPYPVTAAIGRSPRCVAQRQFIDAVNQAQKNQVQRNNIATLFGLTPQYHKVGVVKSKMTQSSQAKEQPVQRVINFKDEVWGAGTEEDFLMRYGASAIGRMLKAIRYDVGVEFSVLDDAVAHDRVFHITEHSVGNYSVQASSVVTTTSAGKKRIAWGVPELMNKPKFGVEDMQITGLSSCLGIYVARIGEKAATEAVSGAHFVTPECIDKDGRLNNVGINLVTQLVALVSGSGMLISTLVRSGTATGASATSDDRLAINAMAKVKDLLNALGVGQVIPYPGHSEVTYRLNSEGDSSWA